MHQGLNRYRLAIAGWTVEDSAPLPGHTEILVNILTVEELMHEFSNCLFHVLVQNNVLQF